LVGNTPLWPLLLYFVLVLIVVGVMVGLPSVIGERPQAPQKGTPYESGIAPSGTIRSRVDVKFYLNAMFFVVFDLESAFLVAWAIAFREVGWAGYLGALLFVVTLLIALVYIWRMGALDLSTFTHRRGR
jgi:NADH-quinone oxidoreductase subunit A